MPASNISSKLLGGRKSGPKMKGKPKGPLTLSPTQLGEITMEKEVLQAMTTAKLEVVIRISAGGTQAYLEDYQGAKVGGLDDLSKIYGLRSFVAKEKKQSASEELQADIVRTAYFASLYNKEGDKAYVQPRLDKSFIVAAKPHRAALAQVSHYYSVIKNNYGTEDKGFQDLLLVYCIRYMNALEKTLAGLTAGKKEKGLLEELCFTEGLPGYFRTKLGMKSLGLTNDMDLSRVIFPQDPSKGLALSVREWMDADFLGKQGNILKNSTFLIRLFESERLVQELSGLPQEQFSNVEDPRTQRVLRARMLVVPLVGHERVLEPLSRQNFRGFGLPNTAMDQSKDRLANLCAIPIRAYAFSIRMAETRTDFYDRFTTPGAIKQPDDKLGNYAKQMLTYLNEGNKTNLMAIIRLEEEPRHMMAWVHRECKIVPGGDLSKMIAKYLEIPLEALKDDTAVAVTAGQPTCNPFVGVDQLGHAYDGLIEARSKSEEERIELFTNSHFSLQEKEEKKKRSEAASVLGKPARAFIKYVKKEHSRSLALALEAYFRGFYSSDMQTAAVNLAMAKFDEIEEALPESPENSDADDGDSEDED